MFKRVWVAGTLFLDWTRRACGHGALRGRSIDEVRRSMVTLSMDANDP